MFIYTAHDCPLLVLVISTEFYSVWFHVFPFVCRKQTNTIKFLHGVITVVMHMTVSIKTKVFLSFCIGIRLFDCLDAI